MNKSMILKVLELKRKELQEALANGKAGVYVERVPDPMDDALAMSNRAVAIESQGKKSHTLALVEHAIKKLVNQGTNFYGVCENCQDEIPETRLAAVPWASYCRECAGRFEREVR